MERLRKRVDTAKRALKTLLSIEFSKYVLEHPEMDDLLTGKIKCL